MPTAIMDYGIAFGDILVGCTLYKRVDHLRQDEKIELDAARVHLVTALRNGLHALAAPWPGLAGPLWTAAHATVAERYALGRKAMDSIYSGGGTFWITGLIAIFILPLVSVFKPVLPIALSLTLAMPDPKATVYAVVVGLVLYWLIERPNAAQRAKTDLSIIGDNTADIEAGDEHGVAPK